MAIGVTKVHGNTENFGAVGRTVQILAFAKTDMSQANIDAAIQFLQLTNSVTGVSEFTAGDTDTLYIAVEGPTVEADGSNAFGVSGATVSVTATLVTR
jgi:hypothetical protein